MIEHIRLIDKKEKMFSKLFSNKKILLIMVVVIASVTLGGYYAFQNLLVDSEAEVAPSIETANISKGDISLVATGTGSLIPASGVSNAFQVSGTVSDIYVAVGDKVETGQVLAELDDADIQSDYEAAKRVLLEMTSDKAIAEAHQLVNTSQSGLNEPRNILIWMLSSTLFYSEERLENGQQALDDLKEAVGENPSAEEEAEIKEAEISVTMSEYNLIDAQAFYEEYRLIKWGETESFGRGRNKRTEYVTVTDQTGETYYVSNGPSEEEIAVARADYEVAKANLLEAQWYYDALLGKELPDDASSSSLVALEQARVNLENAQIMLAAPQLSAPISGTITSLDFNVGDKVDASTNLLTISDLSVPYLEIYLDEADWSLVKVGNSIEASFDALPDQIFNGTIVSVEPSLYTSGNSSVVRGLAKLDSLAEISNFPVGVNSSVDVIGAQAMGVVLVPVDALLEDASGQYGVYLLENGEAVYREVEIGLLDLFYAEVLSGLQLNDVVITNN